MDKNIKLITIASAFAIGGYLIYVYLIRKPKLENIITPSETPSNSTTQSNTTSSSNPTNNTPAETSPSTPSSTNNVESNSNTSYQTYGNTSVVNNPAYQNYVSAVKSGNVSDTYQNYMASVPEGNTSPSQYLTNYIASTKTSTDISNLPGWIQAQIKAGGTYTDVNTGITYV